MSITYNGEPEWIGELGMNELSQLKHIKDDVILSSILSEIAVLSERFGARLKILKEADPERFDLSVFRSTPFHPSH